MKLFLSPHNDDETLFGAFTILRESPIVAVVFDSFVQLNRGTGVTAAQRRKETLGAVGILGAEVKFVGLSDEAPCAAVVEAALVQFGQPAMVYAPAVEKRGHPHHNMVGEIAASVFRRVTHYMTYTDAGKSRSKQEVEIADGSWIGAKLRALACYESQHRVDPRIGCWPHFMRDLNEYYV